MWNAEEDLRERKITAFADYYCEETVHGKGRSRKLSCTMAMVLGFLVTLEIMVAGAMIFNIDFHGADSVALVFAFMVLYFGVVAVLTDK